MNPTSKWTWILEGGLTIAFEDGSVVMDTLNMMANSVKMILDELPPLF